MSVPKGKRNTSELQFFITAIDLRREIVDLMLRDFGLKERVRTIEQFAKMRKMSEQDGAELAAIVHKYHMDDSEAEILLELIDKYSMERPDRDRLAELVKAYNLNDLIIAQYPEWLITDIRSKILDTLNDLIMNITAANSIYATYESEFYERRNLQDRAIGNCYQLLQHMQFVISILPVNAQKYMRYTEMIGKEIALLKGWRKSDNKVLAKLKKKE